MPQDWARAVFILSELYLYFYINYYTIIPDTVIIYLTYEKNHYFRHSPRYSCYNDRILCDQLISRVKLLKYRNAYDYFRAHSRS